MQPHLPAQVPILPSQSTGGRRRAFTLIELLVVMAIILVIAGATLPGLRGTLDSLNLTGSADNVASVFALARQTAIARNLSVEVRIYRRNSGLGRTDWNTIALVIPALVSGRNNDEWIGTPTSLSGNIIIDPGTGNPAFSSLISLANATASTAPWKGVEQTSALYSLRGLDYVAFRFQANGSTNLPEVDPANPTVRKQWYMSLRSLTAPAGGTVPAANFVALVIDPATGRTLPFRP